VDTGTTDDHVPLTLAQREGMERRGHVWRWVVDTGTTDDHVPLTLAQGEGMERRGHVWRWVMDTGTSARQCILQDHERVSDCPGSGDSMQGTRARQQKAHKATRIDPIMS